MEITQKERAQSAEFWRKHLESIRGGDLVSSDALRFVGPQVQPGNIGYGQGEIRPGELGQWDLYYTMIQSGYGRGESLLASGLSAYQVAQEEADMKMRDQGFDPESKSEALQYQTLNSMTPEQFNVAIERLEKIVR